MKDKTKPKKKTWIRRIFRRRVFVITVLLIQIAFILTLIAGSSLAFRYVGFGFNLLSIVVCLYIINKKEKPAYKVTWVFLILTFPIFCGLLYIVFHSQTDSKKLKKRIAQGMEKSEPYFLLCGDTFPSLVAEQSDCLAQVRYLQNYAGFPVYTRTQTEFFNSGEAFFPRVLEELEKAERYIFLEFFILREGLMLDPIIDLLEKKAKAGLEVRIMYDDLGCFLSLPPDYKQQL